MRPILSLILLAWSVAVAAEIFRWVDDEGVVHFSDQAHPDASIVNIPPARIRPPSPPPPPPPAPFRGLPAEVGGYQQFAITRPQPGAELRGPGGSVEVAIALQPPLRPGHRLELLVDGRKVGEDLTALSVTLQGIARGSHRLEARIIDRRGLAIATAAAVPFALQVASESIGDQVERRNQALREAPTELSGQGRPFAAEGTGAYQPPSTPPPDPSATYTPPGVGSSYTPPAVGNRYTPPPVGNSYTPPPANGAFTPSQP